MTAFNRQLRQTALLTARVAVIGGRRGVGVRGALPWVVPRPPPDSDRGSASGIYAQLNEPMKILTRKETTAEQLRRAAIEAAVSALGDVQGRSKGKPALSGVRAVGTGAVLFTAARVAFKGRRLLHERLPSNEAEDEETTKAREERGEPDDYQAADTVQADEQAEVSEAKPRRPEASGGGSFDHADDGSEPYEGSAEAEPRGRKVRDARDPAATSGPKPARPLPERKPVRRAARKQGLQPSLDLPQQRWPRMSASKR